MGLQDLMTDSASYALDPAKENIIILHSDRYQLVRMAIPHITKLQEDGYRIRLISQFSWAKENLRIPTVYTSLFSSNADLAPYDELWKTYFSDEHVSETPRYDLLGYDLMQALVAWINGNASYQGLQSTISWKQTDDKSGWQNANVKIVTTTIFP